MLQMPEYWDEFLHLGTYEQFAPSRGRQAERLPLAVRTRAIAHFDN